MQEKTLTIILPTLNEAPNIAPMLEAIEDALGNCNHSYEVIFVDDSDDETADIIKQSLKMYKNVHLLHRPKNRRLGLTTAIVEGFKKAKGDYICCMDSNLKHSPVHIPKMVEKLIEEASDIVVASRYKSQERNRVDTIKKVAIWTVLKPMRKTTDPVSNMFIARSDLVKSINFDKLYGRKILIDILTREANIRISEHKIRLRERKNEKSEKKEQGFNRALNSNLHVLNLFVFHRLPEIFKRILTYIVIAALIVLAVFIVKQAETTLETFIVGLALFLTVQSSFMIYLMIYAWENPQRIKENSSPRRFLPPKYSFAIFVPAYHEKDVIGDTIRSISKLKYPDDMKEVVVLINEPTDDGTIEVAREAVKKVGKSNIRVLAFGGKTGKSEGMNIGLKETTKDVITIFDAEDEVHPSILNVINTTMQNHRVDIVQSGVQLMNFHSNWYSLFNVMEYYFWFKSVLHFFAYNGMIPLGGNTVFFKRHWLNRVGGWDASNLTEDADIGIRMSVAGARTKVVYDERHATREETPPTVMGFIKQRTRWNQGFIQTLFKGQWLKFPKMRQKLLALYVLTWLFFQGLLFVLLPLAIVAAFFVETSPILSIVVNLPLYTFFFLFVIVNIGLYEFTKSYSLKYTPMIIVKTIIFYIPFQILLGVSAFRAIIRQSFGDISWEKTAHINAARESMPKA
jgi:cellulose synthase/poly-beta-1,6-N-acetylglucosamine synthase-like glycosyltransferase